MSTATITPVSFSSEYPPERYMGSECEYTIQPSPNINSAGDYVNPQALKALGLREVQGYLSNGAHVGSGGVGLLEYRTQEALGPRMAAAADKAGILVVAGLVEASGLPYDGIYRSTGSYLPDPKTEGMPTQTLKGDTTGYHENYLLVREVSDNSLIDQLLPSFLASKIWAMSGTLYNKGFVFSQKVWGVGGEPVVRNLVRRTDHGKKPMCIIPSRTNDIDILGDSEEWARLEVRYADAVFSPKLLYLGKAATSLCIRMVEQSRRLNITRLQRVSLKDPVAAAQLFAADLTLTQTAETCDGDPVTAMDVQDAFAETAHELEQVIELPDSERDAPQMWKGVCDDLRASHPEKGEYTGDLIYEADFAAKHHYLSQHYSQSELNYRNRAAVGTVLIWDRIAPKGIAQMWSECFPSPVVDDTTIESLVTTAPPGRAAARAKYVNSGTDSMTWAGAHTKTGVRKTFTLYSSDS